LLNSMFYPEVKPHISPSAFATWHRQKPLFVRSYFKGEKTPETSAMKGGTKIHALIEGGFLEAKHRFALHEPELRHTVTIGSGSQVQIFGKPDSTQVACADICEFVDYKTGRENTWDDEKLSVDLKMKLTAKLVLENSRANGYVPRIVRGYIEFFYTEWSGTEVVPIEGKESEVIYFEYTAEELDRFTDVVVKTIEEINVAYEAFLERPKESFVQGDDVIEYARLDKQRKEIEAKQKEIKDRIGEQLSFSGEDSFEHEVGTFYTTIKKTYEYPDSLEFAIEGGAIYTVGQGEQIAAGMSAVKKNYELEHEPKTISKSVGFRPKK